MYQVITFYTLNLHNIICQLYPRKTGKKGNVILQDWFQTWEVLKTRDDLRQDHSHYLLTSHMSDDFQVSQYLYWCNVIFELSNKTEGAYS